MILQSRRGLLEGLGAIIAAPAIVRASSLMPIKVTEPRYIHVSYALGYDIRYEQAARLNAMAVSRSMLQLEEIWAANIFNTGFNCAEVHYEAPVASAA